MSKLMNGNAEIIKFYCVSQINKAYNDEDIIFPSQAAPSHDYSYDYLTTKITSNGVIDYNGTTGNTISYSTDGGNTWSTPSRDARVNVQSGDTVMWKGSATTFNSTNGLGFFKGYYTNASFDVEGNVMSLIYGDDFIGETSLSGKSYAFSHLFTNTDVQNAENLILPATYLSQYCYNGMFDGCTQLTKAPEIYGTEMEIWTCWAMFRNCTSLVKAPSILPAMTLTSNCYADMFRGCTSLTTAPELPATTLASFSYAGMFSGCTSLNYIKMLATDVSEYACLDNWVTNVAASGTFVKNASMTSLPTGEDGIPSGWIVEDDGDEPEPTHDYSQDYFTIVAKEDGEIQVQPECASFWHEGESYEDPETGEWIEGEGYDEYYACPTQYSVNDGEWQTITADTSSPDTFVIEVSTGDEIRFKCNLANAVMQDPYNITNWQAFSKACSFMSSQGAEFDAQGNIMSLVYGDDFENNTGLTYEYTYEVDYGEGLEETSDTCDVDFNNFFTESYVVDASNLILPSTELTYGCYGWMFQGCSSLTQAPQLPATTLDFGCYNGMFEGTNVLPDCTNIDFTSQSVVASGGLSGLFKGTKITDNDLRNILPINSQTNNYYLPVTTFNSYSYREMFKGCTSLTTAPELPSTTLAYGCYQEMFNGCTSLTTAPELPATALTGSCYQYMFSGCTSLTNAPDLLATTLAQYCYSSMFYGCTNLNYIKMLATNISANGCLNNWVNGVANSGTFVKNANTTLPTGSSGIPSGWTVENA